MQIGMTLNAEDFAARVVPALSKLFASNDRTIRRSLLESIDSYGRHLSTVRYAPQAFSTRFFFFPPCSICCSLLDSIALTGCFLSMCAGPALRGHTTRPCVLDDQDIMKVNVLED